MKISAAENFLMYGTFAHQPRYDPNTVDEYKCDPHRCRDTSYRMFIDGAHTVKFVSTKVHLTAVGHIPTGALGRERVVVYWTGDFVGKRKHQTCHSKEKDTQQEGVAVTETFGNPWED